MSDRSKELGGELRPGHYFSDRYVEWIRLEFSGGILIWDEDRGGEGRILFTRGQPFHAGGETFPDDPIGKVLRRIGTVEEADVDLALRVQEAEPENARTKLGVLLHREAGADEAAIEAALAVQTKRRVASAFAIQRGLWRGLWSKSDNIVTKGTPIDGWGVLCPGLRDHASDDELRRFADDLLGHAVNLSCSIDETSDLGTDETDEEVLALLDKPRKPEHVERAVGDRRRVRALFKALSLAGLLERVPAHRGVPIGGIRPSATGATIPPIPLSDPGAQRYESTIPPRVDSGPAQPLRESTIPPAADGQPSIAAQKLIKDIQSLSSALREKSLFAVFSLDEDASDDDLRARYADLQRRFHPDRLAQLQLAPDVLERAKDLSSKLNDAYQTLANTESRSKYLTLVKDQRIKGSATRKVQIEEADKKFKMAQVLLKRRDFEAARDMFKAATEIDAANGEYKAYLAWALWMDPTLLKDVITPKVTDLLKDAVRLAPENPQVHYFIGSVFKVTGDPAGAKKHFKKAVTIDPGHVDAARELRLFEMRKKPSRWR